MEIGNIYSGFLLESEENIKEINSIGRLFIHQKSGAKLYSIENDDDNKVFSISFRTPVYNNTGVPHIIEHSVLCGSKKFPVKEPFVELAKGSLNTFLNALTFSDKTMYPVASKNIKDFYNLMDVYLDAVFHPDIYRSPEIFMQEGWHYDMENSESDISIKGVVYNEMKGAFSSPDTILAYEVQKSLFPDNNYGYESGGNPEYIPKLTYEEFINFHEKYYHPSNSYLYLYGNGDIIDELKFINDNYLNGYSSKHIDSEIKIQAPIGKLSEVKKTYAISINENPKSKTYLGLNFVCGTSEDTELYLAFDILEYLLLETPASPLKKAIIDNKIGKDVYGSFDNSINQPVLSIIVKNSDEELKQKFIDTVFDELDQLIKNGIDKKLIEASINYAEFKLREADYHGMPKGLIYNMHVMDSWLYGNEPSSHLYYETALNNIKQALTTDYFEKLIEKYIINSNHSSLVVLTPEKGLSEAKENELNKTLTEFKSKLSAQEINNIIKETVKLKERQSTKDSPEKLAAIPLLSVNDIDKKAEELPLLKKKQDGVDILYHDINTNKIVYMNLYFDLSTVPYELLPFASLLASILTKVSTEKYNLIELSNNINIYTGGISYHVDVFTDSNSSEEYYPKFCVKSKATSDNMNKLIELIEEINNNTKFDDSSRIKEIIEETKSRIEMVFMESGHILAAGRLASYYSPSGKLQEQLQGVPYYRFISDIENKYEDIKEEVKNKLMEVYSYIFNKNNLLIGITCEANQFTDIELKLNKMLSQMKSEKLKTCCYKFEPSRTNEGLMTPGKVQYVAKGYNFKKLGYKYTGKMAVLRTILRLDYLWNKVRVEGGAYGCFAGLQLSGNVYFVSYRDPNLKETLNVYDATGQYIKNFNVDAREMNKYIIGTISRLDFPLTPSMKGEQSEEDFIRGISIEDIQRERDEVLSTSIQDIRELNSIIEEVNKQNYYCVIGGENKVKENSKLFGELIQLFQ
jgi:Zn-dependent M16 (insulinase) family peptidase